MNTLLKLCFLSCTLLGAVNPPLSIPLPHTLQWWILLKLPPPPALHLTNSPRCCAVASALLPPSPSSLKKTLPAPPCQHPSPPMRALLRWTHCTLNQARLLLVHPVWRCEAGLCDALTPVIVSPKCKAVAPSCGQVFSWEFYSGTVPGSFPQVHTTDGGIQTVLAVGDPDWQSLSAWRGVSQGQAVLCVLPQHCSLVQSSMPCLDRNVGRWCVFWVTETGSL